MAETLKVELDSELVRKFKKKAMKTYGFRKGAIKKAMEEILKEYTKEGMAYWGALKGTLRVSEGNSVTRQHSLWKRLR
jgi:metal-responsive CopG/Arc/MetJ family transcriptional regulator